MAKKNWAGHWINCMRLLLGLDCAYLCQSMSCTSTEERVNERKSKQERQTLMIIPFSSAWWLPMMMVMALAMRETSGCKNIGDLGRISFNEYKLFIFIRILVCRCYCFRFGCIEGFHRFCLVFPMFCACIMFRCRDMAKYSTKINHVINFDVSVLVKNQQWPTQSVYSGI